MSGTHYKILNRRRGPAVWVCNIFIILMKYNQKLDKLIFFQGNRAQIDRVLYRENMQKIILNTEKLTVLAESVDNLLLLDEKNDSERKRVAGIILGNLNVA